MTLVVNTNIASLFAQASLANNQNALNQSLQRLSTGYRINSAADDAAGLQISNTLDAQVRGIGQAINNAQDGTNVLSVAEGTLGVVQDHLQRIRELTVQAASDTNGPAQRAAIKQEIDARIADISRITKASSFNGINLLQGDNTKSSLRLQIGANNSKALDTFNVESALGSATATQLGLGSTGGAYSISTNAQSLTFLTSVDKALNAVTSRRASIGAFQNVLSEAISNLTVTKQNFSASESSIRDTNVAAETANLAKYQILEQASASVLLQANQSTALALKLIG
jgi:flagellin